MSESGKKFLSPVNVFSFKESGKVVNSNDIKNRCVATNLLSMLLNQSEIGIEITNIRWIMEFSEASGKIFENFKPKIMNALSKSYSPEFYQYLKVCSNSAVGKFGL